MMNREKRLAALNAEMAKSLLLLDGSMGAYLQGFGLKSEDFHGARFADHASPLKGNNDLLSLTRPEVIMQVHDELVLEVRAERVEEISAGLRERMSAAAKLRVPLLVETGSGDNWDEAH